MHNFCRAGARIYPNRSVDGNRRLFPFCRVHLSPQSTARRISLASRRGRATISAVLRPRRTQRGFSRGADAATITTLRVSVARPRAANVVEPARCHNRRRWPIVRRFRAASAEHGSAVDDRCAKQTHHGCILCAMCVFWRELLIRLSRRPQRSDADRWSGPASTGVGRPRSYIHAQQPFWATTTRRPFVCGFFTSTALVFQFCYADCLRFIAIQLSLQVRTLGILS